MEIWDLYNEKRELTGITHIRGEKIPEGYYHLAVHVWIKNSKGEYLISLRAADRPTYPLMWESVGGAAQTGDDSLSAALREVKEEVGIDLDPNCGHVIFSRVRGVINGKAYRDIMDVWLFEYDGEPDLNSATTAEVADVRWATRGDIRELYDSGKFVPSLDYFFTEIDK